MRLGIPLLITLAVILLTIFFGMGWRNTIIFPLFSGFRQNLLILLALIAAILLIAWGLSVTSSAGGRIGLGLLFAIVGLAGIVGAGIVSLPVGLRGSERLANNGTVIRATITESSFISATTYTLRVMRCDRSGWLCRSIYVGRTDPDSLFIRVDEATNFIEVGSGDVVVSVIPPSDAPATLTLPPTQVITQDNIADLKLLARVPMGDIGGLAWSPDGTMLAIGASRYGEADADNRWGTWLFEMENLAAPRRLTEEPAGPVAFHPDSTTLASNLSLSEKVVVLALDGTIISEVDSLPLGLYEVDHVQYSPDGRYLGHWGNVETMQIAALGADGAVTEPMAFDMPDVDRRRWGDYLILQGEPLSVLIDAWDRAVIWTPGDGTVDDYIMEPGSTFIASPTGVVMTSPRWIGLFNPPEIEPVWEERDETDEPRFSRPVVLNDMVMRVFFSQPPRLYDLQTGEALDVPDVVQDMPLDLLAMNPDSTVLAIAADDGTLRFYGVMDE